MSNALDFIIGELNLHDQWEVVEQQPYFQFLEVPRPMSDDSTLLFYAEDDGELFSFQKNDELSHVIDRMQDVFGDDAPEYHWLGGENILQQLHGIITTCYDQGDLIMGSQVENIEENIRYLLIMQNNNGEV